MVRWPFAVYLAWRVRAWCDLLTAVGTEPEVGGLTSSFFTTFTAADSADADPVAESASLLDRIQSAFLEEAGATGNPVDPVTPMRLAFLVREALREFPAVRAAQADVFTAVWERRVELAERAASALAAYRSARRGFGRRQHAYGLAGSAALALRMMSLLVAAGVLAYAFAERHPGLLLTLHNATGRHGRCSYYWELPLAVLA
jgi:hypothetical protein